MKSLENKTVLIFDLFFCIVFVPSLVMLGPARYWMRCWPFFFTIVCAYLYACYFVMKYFRLPRLILSHRYVRISVISVVLFGCTWLLTLYPLPMMDFVTPAMSEYQTMIRNYNVSITLWFMFAMVLCYSLTVSFVQELYTRLLLQNIAENQRNKAKLAVFRAQISPHFLFNTLNSLYSLVIGTSQKAEDAVVKFTEILRYTYVTIDREYVTIAEETAYLRNYIDLQKIRLDSHTRVVWQCAVDDEMAMIPPMIMPTLVENAFKYGASTSRDCEISIRISLAGGRFIFEIENMVLRYAGEFRTEMPVGIANCRGRLDVLYPGRYSLLADRTGDMFKVTLEIDMNLRN